MTPIKKETCKEQDNQREDNQREDNKRDYYIEYYEGLAYFYIENQNTNQYDAIPSVTKASGLEIINKCFTNYKVYFVWCENEETSRQEILKKFKNLVENNEINIHDRVVMVNNNNIKDIEKIINNIKSKIDSKELQFPFCLEIQNKKVENIKECSILSSCNILTEYSNQKEQKLQYNPTSLIKNTQNTQYNVPVSNKFDVLSNNNNQGLNI